MAEFTANKNLYQWNTTDTKRYTINEMKNNAQKIDNAFVAIEEKVNGLPERVEAVESSVAQSAVTIKLAESFKIQTPETDDTARLQRAIDSFSASEKGVIFLAPKRYDIKSLNVPSGISLVGVYSFNPLRTSGTWFYCTDTTNAALRLYGNQKVEGISFYYPEQAWDSVNLTPKAYAPTIQLQMDAKRVLLRDVFFQNAYYAIDADRHHEFLILENVQGYAIYRGVVTDHSTDVDRWKTVHFNANAWNPDVFHANVVDINKWTRRNGIAFTVKKADWAVLFDLFCWGYRTGILFTSSANGAPSGISLVSSGFDACGTCIQQNAGWGVNIKDVRMTHFNAFEDNVAMGEYAVQIDAANDIWIESCRLWGADRHGFYINSDRAKIINNHIDQYGAKTATNNADYRAFILNKGITVMIGNHINGNSRSRVYGTLIQHLGNGSLIHRNNVYENIVQHGVQSSAGTNNISHGENIFKTVTTPKGFSGASTNVIDSANDLIVT